MSLSLSRLAPPKQGVLSGTFYARLSSRLGRGISNEPHASLAFSLQRLSLGSEKPESSTN
jgi:hypothetical protein